jgi:hypothetical protein
MAKHEDLAEELMLRSNIRRLMRKQYKHKYFETLTENVNRSNEEVYLRKVVRKLIRERVAVADKVPHRSTGINVLEDLLKKIVPVLETDYKSLTTDREQRESFRKHVTNGIDNLLAPTEINLKAAREQNPLPDMDAPMPETELGEEVDISVGDKLGGDDKYIDIGRDEPAPEVDDIDDIEKNITTGLEDQDLDTTGKNVAHSSFKKIEQNILDSFDLLSNSEDREVFHDYLKTNLLLYMDKFEDELTNSLPDVTTAQYDQATRGGEEGDPQQQL